MSPKQKWSSVQLKSGHWLQGGGGEYCFGPRYNWARTELMPEGDRRVYREIADVFGVLLRRKPMWLRAESQHEDLWSKLLSGIPPIWVPCDN